MFQKKQRILAWILAMALIIGLIPTNLVYAGGGTSLIADNLQDGDLLADRQLDLYDLSGTLIGSVDAFGASLVAGIVTVESGDYYLASPSSGVNVYGVVLTEEIVPVTMTLGVSSLDNQTMTTNAEVNGFTIKAASGKSVVIDDSSKSATDGTAFAKRMKLGGSGTADARSIYFSVTGESQVTAYAMSSSSSSDPELALYSSDGSYIDKMPALGSSSFNNFCDSRRFKYQD